MDRLSGVKVLRNRCQLYWLCGGLGQVLAVGKPHFIVARQR